MLPVLQVGPFAIQFPGLILLVGIWLGLTLSEKYVIRRAGSPRNTYNLVAGSLIAGIVAARIGYVLLHLEAFISSPLSIFSLNPGLLNLWAGVIGSVFYFIYFISKNKLPIGRTVDELTPLFIILWLSISLSNLASGKGYGLPTDLPWGINLYSEIRHPTQIYYTLAGLITLTVLWPFSDRNLHSQAGAYFLQFIKWMAGFIVFLEAFVSDTIVLPGGYRLPQIVAWLLIIIVIIMQSRLNDRSTERITTSQ